MEFTPQMATIAFFTLISVGISLKSAKTVRNVMRGNGVSNNEINEAAAEISQSQDDEEMVDGIFFWLLKQLR